MTAIELRAAIVAPLAALAVARERVMTYPDPVPAPRADGCPECGAFPEVLPNRAYRAFTPNGIRCTSIWHEVTA